MVQELKIMSAQANCRVLADLLGQAYREAVRQSRGRCIGREKGVRPLSETAGYKLPSFKERGLTPGRQRDQLVPVPLDAAGERQLDERDLQGARRQARRPRQLVDVDRRRAKGGQQRARS